VIAAAKGTLLAASWDVLSGPTDATGLLFCFRAELLTGECRSLNSGGELRRAFSENPFQCQGRSPQVGLERAGQSWGRWRTMAIASRAVSRRIS
jgi:hypothetical protein